MTADLDTLLIALYVELTDQIIPSLGFTRSGPGKPPEVTDAELVGRLFSRLLRQSEYNDRVMAAAPLMEAALRWLADQTPSSASLTSGGLPGPCRVKPRAGMIRSVSST